MRDVEGGEAGANWNERRDRFPVWWEHFLKRSAVKHGSEANPGTSPTAAALAISVGDAGMPKFNQTALGSTVIHFQIIHVIFAVIISCQGVEFYILKPL